MSSNNLIDFLETGHHLDISYMAAPVLYQYIDAEDYTWKLICWY
jgi:hypothetical protein